MNTIIRNEMESDVEVIFELTKAAFENIVTTQSSS
jgi:predicted N-acetyltransferase YhbS